MTHASEVYALSDAYVERYAALDPMTATMAGIGGHDHELTDFSADAANERAEHDRATLRKLDAIEVTHPRDRIAAGVLRERVQAALDAFEAGDHLRPLAVLGSPVGGVREVFDLMATDTDADWELLTERMLTVPGALSSLEAALADGIRGDLVAARRQALGCAQQAETWAGTAGEPGYFARLAARAPESVAVSLRDRAAEAASRADRAYGALARYLRNEYAPHAAEADGVGEERYARAARNFLGIESLDLAETYAWGWEELARIEAAMVEVAERIRPGEPLRAVVDFLEHDPTRMVVGADALQAYLQDLMDRTIAEMHGVHFDIPEPVRTVEAMIAPPGGAAAMYYTPPAEDFSRPGRTWYPVHDRTEFPLWHEVTTCYHEGVPGHHLQIGQVVYLAAELSRFQRTLAWSSGHGEGWALYAERLMGELGYLEDPAYELGMLAAQAFRAARVVVDIGLHCGLPLPAWVDAEPGPTWTPDFAHRFMLEHAPLLDAAFATSEVDRYLGLPGQAISYKVGERVWLEGRDEVRRRQGEAFDLRAFHAAALDLGPLGLDQLRTELAAL